MKTDIKIPATLKEAIAELVALDVARWGEGEREASRKLNARQNQTYGLALNCLAHRPEYGYGDAVPHLVAAAKSALTADDLAFLSKGG